MASVIPTKLNNYNIYAGPRMDKLLGAGDELTLPDFEASAEDVSGAGILGEISDPTIGYFGNQEMEIPFRVLDKEATSLFKMNGVVSLTIRGAIQAMTPDGNISFSGARVVVRGLATKFSAGKMKRGETMDTSITLSLRYILVEIDGETVVELDKLNNKFVINGEDMLASINPLI